MPGQDSGSAVSAKRQGQIPVEMEKLEKAISDIGMVVGETYKRLDSILSPSKTSAEKVKKEAEKVSLTSLADNIRSYRYRVLSQSSSLRDMLSRLEL